MRILWQNLAHWGRAVWDAWSRFWFTPTDPATLSLIRVLAGSMLLYTHLVWTLELEAFFGQDSWVPAQLLQSSWAEQGGGQWGQSFFWSHLLWIDSPSVLWMAHLAALIVFAMLAVGLFTRIVSILAYLLTVAYIHRAQNALFGLDQINAMLAFYLMLGPSGARYSLDRWLARRRRGSGDSEPAPSVSANIAIRLIQLHMCVVYFFAGTRKLMGVSWWEGTAMWNSLANLEYQSLDMTWLAAWPIIIAFFSHLTVIFEIAYPALIWPRLTRPVMLMLAVWLHLGIALCMGMATFGLVMLIANVAFVPPEFVRRIFERQATVAAET